jgi:hypothetical protein
MLPFGIRAPQTGVGEHIPQGIEQLSKKGACIGIERIDCSVTIVANQQSAGEVPEISWGNCEAPWGIKKRVCGYSLQKIAVRVEDIYDALVGRLRCLTSRGINLRIRDV